MSIAVLASADPGLVMGQAGDLLAGDPVGHNVVGTKLADAIRYGEPGRYWIGLLEGVPAGVAVQQPADTPLAVASMPAELVAAIAGAVDADGVALPGEALRCSVTMPLGPAPWGDTRVQHVHRQVRRQLAGRHRRAEARREERPAPKRSDARPPNELRGLGA
jgi:hypothetical protein